MNVNLVSEARLCSNCGACKAICPKDCIEFAKTSIGRLYAQVDENCIDCSLCTEVCPSLDKQGLRSKIIDSFIGIVKNVYVGKSLDEQIYHNAQSGGVCTAILTYLFYTKRIDAAIVTKMEEGVKPRINAVVVKNVAELTSTQKSCYTPIDVVSALKKCDQYKSIAIVGLPCHIQGVKSLMKKSSKYGNISYLLGLICDRTLCESIIDVYSTYCDIDLFKIDWRRKDFTFGKKWYGYQKAPLVAYSSKGYINIFPNVYRHALKNKFTSPRCRLCRDKLNLQADIVLGDPWGMSEVDMKHGSSLVITRNERGEQLIMEMIEKHKLLLQTRPIEEVLKGQHINEKRKQTSAYSIAMKNVFPSELESYLYEPTINVSERSIAKARQSLSVFAKDENEPIDIIVKASRKLIMRAVLKKKIKDIIKKIISPLMKN